MSSYAVVNADGVVTNVIEWDGQSEFPVPDGCILVPAVFPDPTIEGDIHFTEIGGTYKDGVFTRAGA